MRDNLQFTDLVRALASQPRLPGLTPLNTSHRNESQRTSRVIQDLLKRARTGISQPRH